MNLILVAPKPQPQVLFYLCNQLTLKYKDFYFTGVFNCLSAAALANNVEMDLFGSFSVDDSINSLALVPIIPLESDVPIQSSDCAINIVPTSSTSIFNQVLLFIID